MTLTIRQIHELALFAGLNCQTPDDAQVDPETELYVDIGPITGDAHTPDYHGLRACFSDYPDEGYIPLYEA